MVAGSPGSFVPGPVVGHRAFDREDSLIMVGDDQEERFIRFRVGHGVSYDDFYIRPPALVRYVIPVIRWLERFVRPRWTTPVEGTKRVVGGIVFLLSAGPLALVPLSDMPPALAIMLIAFAYLEEDSVLLCGALVIAFVMVGMVAGPMGNYERRLEVGCRACRRLDHEAIEEMSSVMTIIFSVKINDGIVLAADSARTMSSGHVYTHANKITHLCEGVEPSAFRSRTAR
jgi:hypothetical protein